MPLYTQPLYPPIAAPSGTYQNPINMLSTAASTMTSGSLFFMPYDVGPGPKAFNAFGVYVNVAQSGGSTTTSLGLYRDNGTGGLPNLVGGPLYSGTMVLTGTTSIATSVAMSLSPGRYWTAFLYVVTTAPTTAAQVNQVNNAVGGYASTVGNAFRGLTATAQTVLPTTQIALTSVSGTVPLVTLRAA